MSIKENQKQRSEFGAQRKRTEHRHNASRKPQPNGGIKELFRGVVGNLSIWFLPFCDNISQKRRKTVGMNESTFQRMSCCQVYLSHYFSVIFHFVI